MTDIRRIEDEVQQELAKVIYEKNKKNYFQKLFYIFFYFKANSTRTSEGNEKRR